MLRGNHLEREGSEFNDSIRTPANPNFNAPEQKEEDSYRNSRENRSSNSATYGHISAGTDSSAEFNRISGELNLRISREMDEVMNSAVFKSKGLLMMQKAIMFCPKFRTPSETERPERNPKDNPSQKIRVVHEVSSSVFVSRTKMLTVLTTWTQETTNLQLCFPSFSRDECHQKQLSTNLMMITIHCLMQQNLHKNESHQWPYRTQLIGWQSS